MKKNKLFEEWKEVVLMSMKNPIKSFEKYEENIEKAKNEKYKNS